MPTKTENVITLKSKLPEIRPGDTVRVHQKVKEKDKERIQTFEGLVLAKKHGKEAGATITVRKVISGVGVEKIFPLHSPIIDKIEVVKRNKARRAKLYYLREAKGKKARLKKQEFADVIVQKEEPAPSEETPEEEGPKEEKSASSADAPERRKEE